MTSLSTTRTAREADSVAVPLASSPTVHATLDATECFSPVPIVMLKSALKKQPENSVLAISTTDLQIGRDFRDFCASTGNAYLGASRENGHEVHYVKKRTLQCQTCSRARVVLAAVAAAGALAYTAPQVLTGNPQGWVTVVFAAAPAALPPVFINGAKLLGEVVRAGAREVRGS